MGRPPSKNPKSFSMYLRMTKDEYELLAECAELANKHKSEIILEGIKKVYEEVKMLNRICI